MSAFVRVANVWRVAQSRRVGAHHPLLITHHYNHDLSALDDKQNRLDAREKGLNDLSLRILAAVKAQFGPDSSEYELVGGVRRSERKKPVRKASAGSGTSQRQMTSAEFQSSRSRVLSSVFDLRPST